MRPVRFMPRPPTVRFRANLFVELVEPGASRRSLISVLVVPDRRRVHRRLSPGWALRMYTRSDIVTASSISCVTATTVFPVALAVSSSSPSSAILRG